MDWDVVEATVADRFTLRVRFRDGLEGTVAFLPTFFRGVFTHLRDEKHFQEVAVVDGVVVVPCM